MTTVTHVLEFRTVLVSAIHNVIPVGTACWKVCTSDEVQVTLWSQLMALSAVSEAKRVPLSDVMI